MQKIIELYLETKVIVPFYEEDFAGSDTTFDEFLNDLLEDVEFRKEVFVGTILDSADDMMEGLAETVEENRVAVLLNVRIGNERRVPSSVRDFE